MKPDLVVCTQDRVVVIDVQVINDQFPLETAHNKKISKYQPLESQLAGLRPKGGGQYSTLTVSWRVAVAESSGEELVGLGVLRKSDFCILMARLMVGSAMIHHRFQRMTCGIPASKKGVG